MRPGTPATASSAAETASRSSAEAVREPEHGQRVVRVEPAREVEVERARLPADLDRDARARRVGREARQVDVRLGSRAVRHRQRLGTARGIDERVRMPVVRVDHADARSPRLAVLRQPLEQADLGPAIGVERAVEVEVLVRQVGEDRRVVVDARDAVRRQAVRARLDHHRLLARVAHLAQDPLEIEGPGRRVRLLVADQAARRSGSRRSRSAPSRSPLPRDPPRPGTRSWSCRSCR